MTALPRALALFTVLPVPDRGGLTRADAVAALRWLPLVGAGLGALAGLPLAATLAGAPHAALLGAVLATVVLVVATRGVHLDGLADTADGLGSRAPAPRALEIMRQSDIGPFGVAAVALVLLVDVAALHSVSLGGGGSWRPVAALAVAAATGRGAVLAAAVRGVRPARGSGFGALVAGSVASWVAAAEIVLVLGLGAGLAAAVHASIAGWVGAQAGALVLDALFTAHAVRRLGGVTGDVFGALVEIGAAATLAGIAFS